MTVVNKHNKHIIIAKTQPTVQVVQEQKESREELRQKLRNKMKTSNKNNIMKMYEQIQDELSNSDFNNETVDGEISENGEKKKKKKKKLNPAKLQSQLINQMANIIRNNSGNVNPTSA